MERLMFDDEHRYSAVEAAIHLARYAVAVPYCRDARVLDIACGEGYGSRFLALSGAREVVGVEVDEDAVERANRRFRIVGVEFRRGDATYVGELFDADSFDLVVSFETIEHLAAPEAFLKGLKSVLRPDGTLIVSCPNDHWYFPDATEANPYHLRKYWYSEFKEMSERILGPASDWLLGGPVMGFGSISTRSAALSSTINTPLRMNDFERLGAGFAVPALPGVGIDSDTSSYFVGIWGAGEGPDGSAVIYALSMRGFEEAFFPVDCRNLVEQIESLTDRNQALERQITELAEQAVEARKSRLPFVGYAQMALDRARELMLRLRRRS
jgi:SAM-dependent methyltransferase